MSSVFTKIINGEIPSVEVARSENSIAIMDIFPLRKGHVLVFPKKEVDQFFDLDDESIADLMQLSKKVAKGMKQVLPCNRIGMSVIGLEVPHAHIHLIPINTPNDINFVQDKLEINQDELKDLAHQIAENMPK